MSAFLEIEGVSKQFGGLRAVDNVAFSVEAGELVCLIGPNGAGKTTLFNLLTGQLAPSAGQVLFEGRDVSRLSPDRRARLGFGRTFQISQTLTSMSVLENGMVGAFLHHRSIADAADAAAHALEMVGLGARAADRASALTLGERRRLEVARALSMQPRIVLLDEVMAGLNQTEVTEIVDLVLAPQRAGAHIPGDRAQSEGRARVFASRHRAQSRRLARRGTRRRGAQRSRRDRILHRSEAGMTAAPLLQVEGLDAGYGEIAILHDVGFDVDAGEIVAIVGANGAGKTTLLSALAGLLTPRRGRVTLAGEVISGRKAHELPGRGLALVPEGGRLFPFMSIEENLELGAYAPKARAAVRQRMDEVMAIFPVLSERRKQLAGRLSGGERQMCAIARALMCRPSLLMLDEPSVGLSPLMSERVLDTIARSGADRKVDGDHRRTEGDRSPGDRRSTPTSSTTVELRARGRPTNCAMTGKYKRLIWDCRLCSDLRHRSIRRFAKSHPRAPPMKRISNALIRPVVVPKAADVLAERLRNLIVQGHFSPGDMLPTERDLVVEAGLSRTSVRDALRVLESEGLITTKAGRAGGSIVTLAGPRFGRALGRAFRAHAWHSDSTRCWNAASRSSRRSRASPPSIARRRNSTEMTEIHRQFVASVDDVSDYKRINIEWHLAVARASGNEPLTR